MGIFTNLAVSALMSTTHPTLDRKLCWNIRPHRERCTACQDICPKGVFSRPGFVKDWAACEDCGLCVSVCKSRCIMPSGEQVERDLKPMDADGDRVWIGCERSARKNDLVRPCVGSLAWENLAYMALNKKLVIDLTACSECDSEVCVEHVRKVMQRLLEFLGAPLFAARVTLAQEPDDAPYEAVEYSRREMMEHLTKGSKNSTRQFLKMIPGLQGDSEGHGTDHRLLLHQRTKQLKAAGGQPPRFGWYLPAINDKCYGCGKCERSCRAGALKLMDQPDGTTRIVVTPWKCSECGQCAAACSDKAIDGMVLRQVSTLGPVSVHRLTKLLCAECGKPRKAGNEDGLCLQCASRKRLEKRRQENAQRIRERSERLKKEREEKEAAAAAAAAETAAVPETAPVPETPDAAPEIAPVQEMPAPEKPAAPEAAE